VEQLVAAERGFSLGDTYLAGLFFVGVAIVAAIGALSHERERAFSAAVVYLGLGFAAAIAVEVLDLAWFDPLEDPEVVERVAELAVIVALFATGLKLDRPFERRAWSGVARLLAIAMPLTILGVVLFGTQAAGLSLGAAVVLGAVLAPTDPVLAGDVGVGPPGDEEEHEPNFSITGEAGLNDGLAFPFLFLGLFVLEPGGTSWLGEWLLADVVYAIGAGAAIGAGLGYLFAAAVVRLRDRRLLATAFDAWLAVPAVLLIYAATELLGAYGFIAAFVGGLAFRRYEHGHDYNRRVHEGAEVAEKFGELAAILLLGSMISLAGLEAPGVAGWALVVLLIGVIRPVAVLLAFVGSRLPRGERLFMAWFGVRGIGSLYYVAVAVGSGHLVGGAASAVAWTAIGAVVVSIVVHGITAAPFSRRWLPPEAIRGGIAQRD
jgi:sodium/hydrogen antiporter